MQLKYHLEVSLWIAFCEIQFIIPFLSGILKFGYGTVVACCWSGGCCQCHAPFNVITYYVDYWLHIMDNYGPLCLWLIRIIHCFHAIW